MLTNKARSKEEEEICLFPSQLLPLLLSQQMIVDACLMILFVTKEREIDPWRIELIFLLGNSNNRIKRER